MPPIHDSILGETSIYCRTRSSEANIHIVQSICSSSCRNTYSTMFVNFSMKLESKERRTNDPTRCTSTSVTSRRRSFVATLSIIVLAGMQHHRSSIENINTYYQRRSDWCHSPNDTPRPVQRDDLILEREHSRSSPITLHIAQIPNMPHRVLTPSMRLVERVVMGSRRRASATQVSQLAMKHRTISAMPTRLMDACMKEIRTECAFRATRLHRVPLGCL